MFGSGRLAALTHPAGIWAPSEVVWLADLCSLLMYAHTMNKPHLLFALKVLYIPFFAFSLARTPNELLRAAGVNVGRLVGPCGDISHLSGAGHTSVCRVATSPGC